MTVILEQLVAENDYDCDETFRSAARQRLEVARDDEDFANGRTVRNLFEEALDRHAVRVSGAEGTDATLRTLQPEDVM